jgi:hypothetical protein
VLVNPANATAAETTLRDVQEAARAIGLQIHVLNASTSGEIDRAFADLVRERSDALLVAGDGFFYSRRAQFVTLAARDRIPAAYANRDYVAAGGLMSYGTDPVTILEPCDFNGLALCLHRLPSVFASRAFTMCPAAVSWRPAPCASYRLCWCSG